MGGEGSILFLIVFCPFVCLETKYVNNINVMVDHSCCNTFLNFSNFFQ